MSAYHLVFFSFLAHYFERDDVALPGFQKFFKKASEEEREHAEKLQQFQNKRGGRVVLQNIQVAFVLLLLSLSFCCPTFLSCLSLLKKPEKDAWGTGLDAMMTALALEKNVNQSLLDLHKVSQEHNDPHVSLLS